jgi:hypothetical protein
MRSLVDKVKLARLIVNIKLMNLRIMVPAASNPCMVIVKDQIEKIRGFSGPGLKRNNWKKAIKIRNGRGVLIPLSALLKGTLAIRKIIKTIINPANTI